MNEEQLAELLAQHLDTLLAGEALPPDLPPEVADLLTVAAQLNASAPAPHPDFGPALKESLLKTIGGEPGITTPAATAYPLITIIIIAGLVGLGLIVLIGLNLWASQPATNNPETPLVTPAPVQPTVPVTPTPTMRPTLTPTTTPVTTATPVLDILPPLTHTLETETNPPPPPDLAPGPSGSGGGDNDSGGSDGSGDNGDHNRGHGNDDDHHDEDNPGN